MGGTRSRASADDEDLVPPDWRPHLPRVIFCQRVVLSEAKDLPRIRASPKPKQILRFAWDDTGGRGSCRALSFLGWFRLTARFALPRCTREGEHL